MHRSVMTCLAIAAGSFAAPTYATGQTPYSNSTSGRPLQSEDATALERHALELFVSPAELRRHGGESTWSVEPGFALGLVQRLQVDVALPVAYSGSTEAGSAALVVSTLYAFNVETSGLPAFAVRAGGFIPVAGEGSSNAYQSVKALVSRTYGWGRIHVNQAYTFGDAHVMDIQGRSDSRWVTAVGVDRALPLRGVLVGIEAYASRPLHDGAATRWNVGAGARYQWRSHTTFDLGIDRQLTGDRRGWAFKAGISRSTSLAAILPGAGEWAGRQ